MIAWLKSQYYKSNLHAAQQRWQMLEIMEQDVRDEAAKQLHAIRDERQALKRHLGKVHARLMQTRTV